jgi:hypothetical protein
MFPFAASQAISANRAKQKPGKARRTERQPGLAPVPAGRSWFWRLFDILARSRMRRALVDIEHQRRLREGVSKNESR